MVGLPHNKRTQIHRRERRKWDQDGICAFWHKSWHSVLSVALINTLLKEFGGVKDLFGLQVIN